MISHKHKCIFIHISKCAGTSIEYALGVDIENYKAEENDHRAIKDHVARLARTQCGGDERHPTWGIGCTKNTNQGCWQEQQG